MGGDPFSRQPPKSPPSTAQVRTFLEADHRHRGPAGMDTSEEDAQEMPGDHCCNRGRKRGETPILPEIGEFKLVHAFYVGMLALQYRTSRGAKIIWPNQYIWLLEQRLIDWRDHAPWGLSEEAIRDKSNADGNVKLAAACQVSWFCAQCVMRAVHHLPLSQLESMTLSYIPLFAAIYFFWWLKPKNIMSPSVVRLPEMSPEQRANFEYMTVSRAFDEGPTQRHSPWNVWMLTPRVFEKEAEDKAWREAEQSARQGYEIRIQEEAHRRKGMSENRSASALGQVLEEDAVGNGQRTPEGTIRRSVPWSSSSRHRRSCWHGGILSSIAPSSGL